MKSALLALAFTLSALVAMADQAVDTSNLPPAVQRTIKEWKGQGEVKKVKTVRMDGQVAYEVEYKEGGDEKQILIGQDGSVIRDEKSQGKGKAKGKGKGKGKAKGQNRDRQQPVEESPQVQPSTAPPQPPAPQTPAPQTPAPQTPAPASTPPPAPTPAPSRPKEPVGTSPARSAKEIKAEFERQMRQVNTLDNSAQKANAGLAAIAKETGVPLATIEAQRKQYGTGTGGLLLANEMANATGKPAATFLKQRQNREWDRIATENKFDLSTVLPKLDRVRASMEAVQPQKKTKR